VLFRSDTSAACDDGDACMTGETCQSGSCTGSLAVDCSAFGDDCNDASCDGGGAEGNCDTLAPANDGSSCTGGPVLTEPQCEQNVCDTGACVTADDNEGNACDDGIDCNVGETCQSGLCDGGSSVDCSGLDTDCTESMCVEGNGEGNCDDVGAANEAGVCSGCTADPNCVCETGVCVDD